MQIAETAEREVTRDHVTDASGFEGWAERAFAPSDEAGVAAVLAAARAAQAPVTVLGSGSGLTGARVAQGGWVLSLERFRKIEIFDGFARAGAAVTLKELNATALASRQFYAPDPTENMASVGGTISTNASGSRSFRFGSTRRHVLALRVALMDGRVVEYRRGEPIDFEVAEVTGPRTTKCAAGYALRPGMDWVDLFCGAEGTLGVLLEAELRLLPIPEKLFSAVVFFPSDDDAQDAIEQWRGLGELRMLEYLDGNSLDLMRGSYRDIPAEARAALMIEAEGDEIEAWEERLNAARALIEGSWFAVSADDRERFRKLRHALPEAVNSTMLNRGYMKMGTDYVVPVDRNRDMLRYYRERLDAALPGHYVIYGHIGDAHVHVNMLPADDAEMEKAGALMKDFARQAAAMGGAVSAEHGLGKRKASFMQLQYAPEQIEAMKAVKRRLDPDWLLGRGTLFAAPA